MTPTSETKTDYAELVRFLVKPFLETPDSLRVDCESRPQKARVWIRLAFAASDKGRVFGRGGRNIQAIRTVVEAAAKAAGQSIYLDIYGSREEASPEKRSLPKRRPAPKVDQAEPS